MRRFWVGVGLLVLSGLALITHRQAVIWQTDLGVWREAVRITPEKPRPIVNAARALALDGQLEAASALNEWAYQAASDPRRPAESRAVARAVADVNHALVLVALQRREEAQVHVERALRQWPGFAPALRVAAWLDETP